MQDKPQEVKALDSLGTAYLGLREFQKSADFFKILLELTKEIGDKNAEGHAYDNLGFAYAKLGNFKHAIEYHEHHLKIAEELEDTTQEERACANLGTAYHSLGNFKKSLVYHERALNIVKITKDRVGEKNAYGGLGNCYHALGEFRKATDCYELCLKISEDLEDRASQGRAHGSLAFSCTSLGNFKDAIDHLELSLEIFKEEGDKDAEKRAYGNLGTVYQILGDFKNAKYYNECVLEIAKDKEDKAFRGRTYGNLGCIYHSLGDFEDAKENHELHLKTAKELGDDAGEGRAYGNLGNLYTSLGNFKKAIEYHERSLKIVRNLGNRVGEGGAYAGIGEANCRIGEFQKGIDAYVLCLNIAKEVGHRLLEGIAYHGLGACFESQNLIPKAQDCYQNSVKALNEMRCSLESQDDWKISLREVYQSVYTGVWRCLLKQDKVDDALLAAELGRAQALNDLLQSNYGFETRVQPSTLEETVQDIAACLPSNVVFLSVDKKEIYFWFVQKQESGGVKVTLRKKSFREKFSEDVDATKYLQSLVKVDDLGEDCLKTLYDIAIHPIVDLVHGAELIIVPEGPLCLAPYAAFMDSNSRYLSETLRIRVIPSLTTLKLIVSYPEGDHCNTGALLVGDPCLKDIPKKRGEKRLPQLPGAKKEVEVIAKILNAEPLIGTAATKDEVLKRLSLVEIVHMAAHGRMETGEIALAPNINRQSRVPKEADYMLTMKDVLSVKLQAKLVVLSCCYSGRGEIKAEGVVGISRAFLGAGARSVLVALWKINDAATLEFMEHFYQNLREGRSASQAVNRVRNYMRESSEEFREVKYWAPFVLIGDDVTFQFSTSE